MSGFEVMLRQNRSKSSQAVDNVCDQRLDSLVTGVTDVSILSVSTDVGCQMIESPANRLDFTAGEFRWKNRGFEPVVQVIRQHLDQEKPLIALFVTLTVLVKRKTLFEFVNLVLYVAALVVFMEDLLGRQVFNIDHNDLVVVIQLCFFDGELLWIFALAGFSQKHKPIGLLPLGKFSMDFIDTEHIIYRSPRIQMLSAVYGMQYRLDSLVFLAFDDKFQIRLFQKKNIIDVKSSAIDPDTGQMPGRRKQQPTFPKKVFQFKVGVMFSVLQGQVNDFVCLSRNSNLFFKGSNACMGCTLCAKNYPEAFEMQGNKAIAKDPGSTLDTVKLAKVIEDCPTDAITYR